MSACSLQLYYLHIHFFLPVLPDYAAFVSSPLNNSPVIKYGMGSLVVAFFIRPAPVDFVSMAQEALEVQLLSPLERVICHLLLAYREYGHGQLNQAADHLRNAAATALMSNFNVLPTSPVIKMPNSPMPNGTVPPNEGDQVLSETRYRCWCEIWAADVLLKAIMGPTYMSCWGQSVRQIMTPHSWHSSFHPQEVSSGAAGDV